MVLQTDMGEPLRSAGGDDSLRMTMKQDDSRIGGGNLMDAKVSATAV